MVNSILRFLNNVFLMPEDEIFFKKIFLDKTRYYKAEIRDFALDNVFVACEYDDNMKNNLQKLKYHHDINSLETIASYYSDLFDRFVIVGNTEDIIITGVPIFTLNRFIRGYNQTYLIGKILAKKKNLEFIELVKKIKYTRMQAGLSKNKRLSNLKNCFKANSKYNESIIGKTIILVDDVISTGTTANEVSKILKMAGAKEIIGIFLATGK